MIGKTTALFICIHKRVKSIILSIKFCDESGLAILKVKKTQPNTRSFVDCDLKYYQ